MRSTDPGGPRPLAVAIAAADGFVLRAYVWRRHARLNTDEPRPVVIVNSATSVRCHYYFRFGAWLHEQGFDVLVYDYRGIGASQPVALATLDASWLEWGERDFEAVLRYVRSTFPGQPIDVVGHSIGGFLIGLAPSNHLVRRVFTVGTQYAYWRDYAPRSMPLMLWKWHVVMPVLTCLKGYFPASWFGWMEDTPRGVVNIWSRGRARFEDTLRKGSLARTPQERAEIVARFGGLRAPILAVSFPDDPFATIRAIERTLRYFTHSDSTHLRIAPASVGERSIGHFAFFHSRFERSLWPVPWHWLTDGNVIAATPAATHPGPSHAVPGAPPMGTRKEACAVAPAGKV
ncbi:alpha/beta hydrolase family protein [Paraburkholderia acidiphila]|uniref:Alpha/beta fold hydrolase n=1 Tax=Paraburkholderia acidiphila TaxID=2571747 RepID=A0A7Z2GC25_9BURK|nr:alpha/beta fold hydrolase [Paraburkholderia acidiphila]QGZ59036.1 alpha/beta fold hydrolase [Paraburkholderia acidiphila]